MVEKQNNAGKCFQYAIFVALNYQNIDKNPETKTKIKLFINQYNWKEINFPSHRKVWKSYESNNKSIIHNILYIPYNTEKIKHAYKSKHNLNRENQENVLMITNGKNGNGKNLVLVMVIENIRDHIIPENVVELLIMF